MLAIAALLSGTIALAVLVATIDVWIVTWPSFGITLIAVPAGLVAMAFGSIAWAAAKAAVQDRVA